MKPTVNIESFKEWYFDEDTKESEGKFLIRELLKKGKVSLTIRTVFKNCGYIPSSICENLTEEQKQDTDLEFEPNEVTLID